MDNNVLSGSGITKLQQAVHTETYTWQVITP